MLILYTDGGCTNSNQKNQSLRKMIWVTATESGEILVERERMGGSNNIAELMAIWNTFQWAMDNFIIDDILIRTDSKVALAWIQNGKFGKHLNNRALVSAIREQIKRLSGEYLRVTFEWVPREKNIAGQYIENKYSL